MLELLFSLGSLKHHRLINIQTSSRVCSSTREFLPPQRPHKSSAHPHLDGQYLYACSFCTFTCAHASTGRKFSYVSPGILEIPPSPALQGALICVLGLGLLVGADQLTNKDWAAVDKGKGDAFMILGATLYGFSAS